MGSQAETMDKREDLLRRTSHKRQELSARAQMLSALSHKTSHESGLNKGALFSHVKYKVSAT